VAHCHTTKCNLDSRKSDAILLKGYRLISLRNHNGDTPVLTGEDAARFEKATKANEKIKVSPEEYKRAHEAFKRISFK